MVSNGLTDLLLRLVSAISRAPYVIVLLYALYANVQDDVDALYIPPVLPCEGWIGVVFEGCCTRVLYCIQYVNM